ncbi:MAG TPA: class I SAM-dependent methyltransferase [Pseudonocardia sp.]|uniref:class I SAM-dependent methyltransferase n=1 Tax=Pseudonocardia sp. TaxID=60912 RepID=UPI002C178390|nr:class I SAM-dependent methyltransferase [Pseudonocardia sp.]HTF46780.1 class I SAM-dependent methyltransferase [Pseudonocardia sp.]
MNPGPAGWGRELYGRVLDALGTVTGGPLLDVGCGAGELCRLAVDRGISVRGVDASPDVLASAARLVPEAELLAGALPALPVPDRSAAAVTCVQVLMHVPNPVAALRELARVARPGAPVVATVWGPVEQCAFGAFGRALAPFLGGPLPGGGGRGNGGPPPLSAPGRLAKLAGLAGLVAARVEDVRCPFDYPDERALLAGLYAAEVGRRAVALAGARAPVRKAVLAGLAEYRTASGGYRLENTFQVLVAQA